MSRWKIWTSRAIPCGIAALLAAAPPVGAEKPYGIERRTALTTSTVVGSPDPPPPFRIRRAYPQLNLDYPITVAHQPGSDRVLLVTQIWSSGPGRLLRIKDEPDA